MLMFHKEHMDWKQSLRESVAHVASRPVSTHRTFLFPDRVSEIVPLLGNLGLPTQALFLAVAARICHAYDFLDGVSIKLQRGIGIY